MAASGSGSEKPAIRCHYEVLGVERDTDAGTIKKAHRRLALQLHPDKNVGNDEAHHQFLAVQQAYECLSDAAERKWYDEHRDAILQGWTAHGDNDQVDILFEVVPFMHAGCYSGYDDNDRTGSFYAVYSHVFAEILKGEMNGDGSIEYLSAVAFGNSHSPWDNVAAFYQAWESFSSTLSFAWADAWDLQLAEHRQVRRAMEDENKKARRQARRTRNDDVLALVHFVKRRDPRVRARLHQVAQEKEQQQKQLKAQAVARKKEKQQAMEQWRQDAEEQTAAAEEEDRKAGRIRLADLEDDDYDYAGGKKKGKKGKKKKNKKKQQQESSDEDDGGEQKEGGVDESAENDAGDDEDSNINTADNERLGSKPEDAAPTESGDLSSEVESSSEEEPDSWRCECCRKDFKSEGQMENHLKSKKHKVAWKKYEAKMAAQLEQEALEEMMDDLDVED